MPRVSIERRPDLDESDSRLTLRKGERCIFNKSAIREEMRGGSSRQKEGLCAKFLIAQELGVFSI